MTEELSARDQILRHIKLVDTVTAATGEPPPVEWQELRRRFEAFDNAVQMQRSDDK